MDKYNEIVNRDLTLKEGFVQWRKGLQEGFGLWLFECGDAKY